MITTLGLASEQKASPRNEEWQENSCRLDEVLGLDGPALGQKPFYERATME